MEKSREDVIIDCNLYLDLAIKDVHESMEKSVGVGEPLENLIRLVEEIEKTINETWEETEEIISSADMIKMIQEKASGTAMRDIDIFKIIDVVNLKLVQEELFSEDINIDDIHYYYNYLKELKENKRTNSEENYFKAVTLMYESVLDQAVRYYKESSLQGKEKILQLKDGIFAMPGMLDECFGNRELSAASKYPKNFKHMRNLMENAGEHVNRGYVAYCFNLITDWYNYILYFEKKDFNIFDYQGLALKQAACNYFCMKDVPKFFAHSLTNGFWEKAETMREEMIEIVVDDWKVQGDIYERYAKLYDMIRCETTQNINNRIIKMNRDFIEYWIWRFENGVIEKDRE